MEFNCTPISPEPGPLCLSAVSPQHQDNPRLLDSIRAIDIVFRAVIEDRVRTGDNFFAEVELAKGSDYYDLAQTVKAAPATKLVNPGSKAKYMEDLFKFAVNRNEDSLYNCVSKSPISIIEYINRLLLCAEIISSSTYLLAIKYIDLAVAKNVEMLLNSRNVHRIVLAALVVAIKFNEDFFLSDYFLAEVGGVTSKELNDLVWSFLEAIDFKCCIDETEFAGLEQSLMEEALDSADGYSVYLNLHIESVHGLREALANSKEWGPRNIPISPIFEIDGTMISKLKQMDERIDAGSARSVCHTKGTEFSTYVSALARVLAEYNFSSIPIFPGSVQDQYLIDELLPCYPLVAQSRFQALAELACNPQGISTLVPPMYESCLW